MHRTVEDPRRWHRSMEQNVRSETLNSNPSPTGAHAPNPILSTRRNCIKHYREQKQTRLHSRIKWKTKNRLSIMGCQRKGFHKPGSYEDVCRGEVG